MTATIAPNTILVDRSNVQDRLNDYKKTIEFYLNHTDLPIYFIENSAYDLSEDKEFKAFTQNVNFNIIRKEAAPDTSKGKGYQEFYLLDDVVKNHITHPYFFKVTGRYIVENIGDIISQVRGDLSIDQHKKMRVAITGFFGVRRDFYLKNFSNLFKGVDDAKGVFIEHIIYNRLQSSELRNKSELLPLNPLYKGISGSHGNSMERNPYKMMIRKIERSANRILGIRQFLVEY